MFRREFLKISSAIPFVGLIPTKKEEKEKILPIGTRIWTKNLDWSEKRSDRSGMIIGYLTFEEFIKLDPDIARWAGKAYKKDKSIYSVLIGEHTHLYRDEFEILGKQKKDWQLIITDKMYYFDNTDALLGCVDNDNILHVYDNNENVIKRTNFGHPHEVCTINDGADFIKKTRENYA